MSTVFMDFYFEYQETHTLILTIPLRIIPNHMNKLVLKRFVLTQKEEGNLVIINADWVVSGNFLFKLFTPHIQVFLAGLAGQILVKHQY